MSLQEKFQTILPSAPMEDDGTEWTAFSQSRQVSPDAVRNNTTAFDEVDGKFNKMPSVNLTNETPLVRVMSGSTDASADTNPEALTKGYTRRPMNGSDDQYTGEHADHFYGECMDGEGQVGFAERNNYMDRM